MVILGGWGSCERGAPVNPVPDFVSRLLREILLLECSLLFIPAGLGFGGKGSGSGGERLGCLSPGRTENLFFAQIDQDGFLYKSSTGVPRSSETASS